MEKLSEILHELIEASARHLDPVRRAELHDLVDQAAAPAAPPAPVPAKAPVPAPAKAPNGTLNANLPPADGAPSA